jgi:hypothetical protein
MLLYHVSADPEAILDHGFVDGPGFYRSGKLHRGVWLYDRPIEGVEASTAADSRTVVVDIPDEVALRHEWLEEHRDYRQFLIPAELVNRYLTKS